MPPLLSISAFRRTDANGGSRGEAMPERENVKNVNIVLGRAKRQSRAKREQIMAEFLGHSKDLITLSLSLSLSHALTASHTLLRFAGDRALIYGFSWNKPREAAVFFCPPCSGGQAAMTRQQKFFINNINHNLNSKQVCRRNYFLFSPCC